MNDQQNQFIPNDQERNQLIEISDIFRVYVTEDADVYLNEGRFFTAYVTIYNKDRDLSHDLYRAIEKAEKAGFKQIGHSQNQNIDNRKNYADGYGWNYKKGVQYGITFKYIGVGEN